MAFTQSPSVSNNPKIPTFYIFDFCVVCASVSPRRFTSTTLRTRTFWKVGMIRRVKLVAKIVVSDFEENNSWYSYWDKSKNKIPCTRFLSFTFDLFQMDKDEKGKQAGWSNPNYEVTEGKLTRICSPNFLSVCTLSICSSSHLQDY